MDLRITLLATILLFAAALSGHCAIKVTKKDMRAYPAIIPPDTSFETVVESQIWPPVKYGVPIIGWKHHPEEVHVTPTGALVFPATGRPKGLYVAPLLSGSVTQDPKILSPDTVSQELVDGYKPGIKSSWSHDGVRVDQLAFCTLLEGTEVITGSETLVAFARYTLTNETKRPKRVVLWLNMGEALFGRSLYELPAGYPMSLAYKAPFVVSPYGDLVARVRAPGATIGFEAVAGQAFVDRSAYTTVNEIEKGVSGGRYEVDVHREGDKITVGAWSTPSGADIYLESSRLHAASIAAELSVEKPNGQVVKLGNLSRKGLADGTPDAGDYLKPGDRTQVLEWSQISPHIPEGTSKLVFDCFYLSADGPKAPGTWHPLIHFAKLGVSPPSAVSNKPNARHNSLTAEYLLKPGESRSVEFVAPYFPVDASRQAALESADFDKQFDVFRKFWWRELNRNAKFVVPEQRITDSYRACLANNLMLVDLDKETGHLLPHPDATHYEFVWAGDTACIIHAKDRLGYHSEAKSYLDYFIARQGTREPEGEVSTYKGFFPGDMPGLRWMGENGFILWALAEHYKLTGDKDWLRRVAPNMIESCDWIITERNRMKQYDDNGEKVRHYGLLPKGRTSDNPEWNHFYWTDNYSYGGLRGTADILGEIGLTDEAARLDAEARDYKKCIQEAIERSLVRDVTPPFVPVGPYKNEKPTEQFLAQTWYSITGPIYMVEMGLIDPNGPLADSINHYVEELVMVTAMPTLGGTYIDPHYVYNQALSQILRGEIDKFVWTLYSVFAYGQTRDTYATLECNDLLTGSSGVHWDALRMPHMHSNSRVIALLRIALLLEVGDRLDLLPATPRLWLADGKSISVESAPTTFGEVSLSALSNVDSGTIDFTIDPPVRTPVEIRLHVRPPSKYGAIKSVTVDGKPWTRFGADFVDLGALEHKTTVVCVF